MDYSKCERSFSRKWQKAERLGDCFIFGDELEVEDQVSTDADIIVGRLSDGRRFVDNGDGTVTDNQTGLMWEKKEDLDFVPGNLHDADNVYTWTDAMSEWISEVNDRTNDPNAQAGLGGHSDWRVPTIVELQTILLAPSPCGTNPCIDPIFGPTTSAPAWSSTTTSSDPNNHWEVNFIDGVVNFSLTGLIFSVRAVRGGP